jgi:hypothetical protein
MNIEPLTLWTAVGSIFLVISGIAGWLGFVRKNDMSSISKKFDELGDEVKQKLSQDEFRRHENREEAQLKAMVDSSDAKFDKLDQKIEDKFEKLFDLLLTK